MLMYHLRSYYPYLKNFILSLPKCFITSVMSVELISLYSTLSVSKRLERRIVASFLLPSSRDVTHNKQTTSQRHKSQMLSLKRTRTIYMNRLYRDYNKFHLSNNFKKDKTNLHDKSKSLDRKNKDSFVLDTAVKRLPKISWLLSFSDKN